jgi:hypothetical protein
MVETLRPEGHLVIVAPAFQWLFSALDEYAGHYRRYTRQSLRQVLENSELEVVHDQYFNTLGILGWIFFKAFPPKSIDEPSVNQGVRLFDKIFVPLASIVDAILFHLLGLSVLVVARKPN